MELSITKKKLHELLQCPICMEIPLSDVFQCENGHMICDKCIIKVGERCPQCRVVFGQTKIRNLAVEAILDDTVGVPCVSKKYYCFETLKRHEVAAHNKICKSRAVSICRNLGYRECFMECRFKSDLIHHLLYDHRTEIDDSHDGWTKIRIKYADFHNRETTYYYPAVIEMGPSEPEIGPEYFLILVKFEPEPSGENTCKCAVFFVGDENKHLRRVAADFKTRVSIEIEQGQGQDSTMIAQWFGPTPNVRNLDDESQINYFNTPTKDKKRRVPDLGEAYDIAVTVFIKER